MAIKYNDLYMDLRRRLREAGAEDAGRHGQSLHRREQDARAGSVQLPGLGVESWVVADIPACNHQMGQTKDVLPAVPPVEAQQHIAADGEVQLIAGILPGQLFQREDAVILPALLRLLHLPAADLEAEAHLPGQLRKAAAHLHPERAGGGCPLLEGGDTRRHDHHAVRADPGSGGAEVVQVAVVGRVEGAAVKQDTHHFSRSA